MDEKRIEGTARNFGGKVQDAVGGLTGDTATQIRGKANQAAGAAQDTYGQVIDEMKDFATEQPITAMLAAMGVGLALGFLIGRR